MGCLTFWLRRFDHAPQQFIELGFVGCGDAGSFGLGNEIRQSVEPDGLIQG